MMLRVIDGQQSELSKDEVKAALKCISDAAFSADVRSLEQWAGPAPATFVGLPHPSRPNETISATTQLNSLEFHLLKHRLDGSWAANTTTEEYIRDIRNACLHPAAVLDLGRDAKRYPGSNASRSFPRACTRVESDAPPRLVRVNSEKGTCVLVIYAPDLSRIVSSYRGRSADAERRLAAWKPRHTFRT